MRNPQPIFPDRLRNIRQCTFGWVDHDFLHRGYLNRLSQEELLLYYFLITVADRNGVSFYDYERICQLLKLELDTYLRARNRLCELSLIAYQNGVFQVLSLPAPALRPCEIHAAEPAASSQQQYLTASDFQSLKALLQNVSR
jgi:hypothetical protein